MLVRVLGPLQAERDDGAKVQLPHRMERRLLTALASLHPRPVSVDGLVDALWPDSPPPSARKTLQTNVFRVRKALGPGIIATAPDGYQLGSDVRVDAEEFERTGELDWWRGEPFAELDDWAAIEGRRARLVELRRLAEDAAAETMLAAGRPIEAVAELERLVSEDPFRERRWTLLVRVLVAADRRPEALRAYDRARRTLAVELGISPGAELQAAQRAALADDPDDPQPARCDDPIVAIDRLLDTGAALSREGETGSATASYVQAAHAARAAGDLRRFAEATLGAAGEGVRVALDATDEVLSLVHEALHRVPPGPTPTRSRLLARVAVLQSQHSRPADNEAAARSALSIARALDDPQLIVGALTALTLTVVDPLRRDERTAWIRELRSRARGRPDAPWLRWVQPLDARERVLEGDLVGALELFADLDAATSADRDVVGHHAASYGHVLAATVVGDWDRARAAAARVRRTSSAAMFDEGTATLGELGMLAIIDLLEETAPPGPVVALEWPTPEMTATSDAYTADRLARHGQLADATVVLGRLAALLPGITRDGYWLATLSMTASAAALTGHAASAAVAAELLEPCVELTVTDPGLIYRGSAAHFAGLAAAVLARPHAGDLLRRGLEIHERHRSTWMADRSHAALRRR